MNFQLKTSSENFHASSISLNARSMEEFNSRGRMTGVADTELLLLITHLIRPPGSIPDVRWARCNQTKNNRGVYFWSYLFDIWRYILGRAFSQSKGLFMMGEFLNYEFVRFICFIWVSRIFYLNVVWTKAYSILLVHVIYRAAQNISVVNIIENVENIGVTVDKRLLNIYKAE